MRLRGCLNRGRHSEAFMAPPVRRAAMACGPAGAPPLFLLAMAAQLLLIAMLLHVVFRALAPRGLQGGLTPLMVGVNELGLLLPACGASALMAFLEDTG